MPIIFCLNSAGAADRPLTSHVTTQTEYIPGYNFYILGWWNMRMEGFV